MNRPTSQVIMSTSYIHCIVHSRSADGRVLQTAARRLLHGGRQTDRQTDIDVDNCNIHRQRLHHLWGCSSL